MSPAQGDLASTNRIGSTPAQRHVISAAQAQGVLNAAAKCAKSVTPQNIAICDPSGLLVTFLRMDNAYIGSIDLSIKKARTTVLFNGLPSGVVYDLAQPGAPFYGIQESNGGLVVFGGSLPLYKNDFLLGSIGVSGGSPAQDLQVAQAGVDWLTKTTE
ncbi:DUF336-domain-containing protein [Aureobasidium subglaciale]|nr:DUF336-domain-containing protein [Aureobasidium subglaciale]